MCSLYEWKERKGPQQTGSSDSLAEQERSEMNRILSRPCAKVRELVPGMVELTFNTSTL